MYALSTHNSLTSHQTPGIPLGVLFSQKIWMLPPGFYFPLGNPRVSLPPTAARIHPLNPDACKAVCTLGNLTSFAPTGIRTRVTRTCPPTLDIGPTGNRTPVWWMRTTCPGPLDDGTPTGGGKNLTSSIAPSAIARAFLYARTHFARLAKMPVEAKQLASTQVDDRSSQQSVLHFQLFFQYSS